VPDAWLKPIAHDANAEEIRTGYLEFLRARMAASTIFEQEAIRAHARII
jgi:hypothetical protein